MYQTVGHDAIELYSQAMGLPLFRRTIKGKPIEQGKDYIINENDEVEDLYELLKDVVVGVDEKTWCSNECSHKIVFHILPYLSGGAGISKKL